MKQDMHYSVEYRLTGRGEKGPFFLRNLRSPRSLHQQKSIDFRGNIAFFHRCTQNLDEPGRIRGQEKKIYINSFYSVGYRVFS